MLCGALGVIFGFGLVAVGRGMGVCIRKGSGYRFEFVRRMKIVDLIGY